MRPLGAWALEIYKFELVPKNLRYFLEVNSGISENMFHFVYREFSPNANFITANFITAVFQNFPDVFCYCDSMYILLMQFFC